MAKAGCVITSRRASLDKGLMRCRARATSCMLMPPPAEPKDDNDTRAIVSRAGTSITFDDKKKSVTIKTPKGSTIVVDDDAESIQLADSNGNKVTLGSGGVKIASAKDIELDASSGKVVIKGTAVDIQ